MCWVVRLSVAIDLTPARGCSNCSAVTTKRHMSDAEGLVSSHFRRQQCCSLVAVLFVGVMRRRSTYRMFRPNCFITNPAVKRPEVVRMVLCCSAQVTHILSPRPDGVGMEIFLRMSAPRNGGFSYRCRVNVSRAQ
ncbi:hypothetical protein BDP67DRAFT_490498 [Colletotrichum lupini]|nr:hypothetical protein BDP67DRAFT_490498 [Colletotrichum lupini]